MSTVGYGLRRPIARWDENRKYAACPRCQSDVSETLGAPSVPTLRLAGHGPDHVDADTINVRGYRCDACQYVLAIAPGAANVDVHEPDEERDRTAPWLPIWAVFVDGSKRPVVVPRREVSR